MKNCKKILSIIFLLSCFTMSYAQKAGFKQGFVVKLSGDTLRGEIDYRGEQDMGRVCVFKSAGKISEYTPDDISSFQIDEGKYYVSREIKEKKVFLEFLIQGMLNVYFLRDESGAHYYIENQKDGLRELAYNESIMTNENGKSYFYHSDRHIKLLEHYMEDAPDLRKNIEQIKEPSKKNLVEIAEKYHYEVCGEGEKCTIYKSKSKVAISLEGLAGIVHFSKEYPSLKNYTNFQAGVVARIWLPSSGNNLYFKTGVVFSPVEREIEEYKYYEKKVRHKRQTYVKIPLYLEYLYGKDTFFKPKCGIGINLNNPFHPTAGLMAGFNLRMKESVHLTVSYDIDFKFKDVLPSRLFSQYFSLGVYVIL
ncbi:MAG: hypothetical protein ACLVKO_01445 [Dysgonomonas sp.]